MKSRYSWLLVTLVLGSLSLTPYVRASENTPAKLSGTEIELFERGHTFAGAVLGTPVFGVFQEDPFGATVQVRKGNSTLLLSLIAVGKLYSGEVVEKSEDGKEIKTTVEFSKITKTEDTKNIVITLKIDGQPVSVRVGANTFQHGHFQGPRFETVLGDKPVSFTFTGQSCFGYSINLAMMVFGTYAHLLK